jgi:hypothetical protein
LTIEIFTGTEFFLRIKIFNLEIQKSLDFGTESKKENGKGSV